MTTARPCAALLAGAFLLAGCLPAEMAPTSTEAPPAAAAEAQPQPKPAPEPVEIAEPRREVPPEVAAYYSARADGSRTLPAVDAADFHPMLLRNAVDYPTAEAPGTIVIDTKGPFLYLVEPEGRATRYGIAIGREGFGWTGSGHVARTARWPGWTPPPAMIKRDPSLAKWADGMPGGVSNPLGARALYINFGGRDFGLPHPRHQHPEVDRLGGVLGLLPHAEPGRGRPLRPGEDRSQGGRYVTAGARGATPAAGRGAPLAAYFLESLFEERAAPRAPTVARRRA